MALQRGAHRAAPAVAMEARVSACRPLAAARPAGARRARLESLVARAAPPDVPKEDKQTGREWLDTFLARFNPVREKAASPTTLDFEKPLLELDKRIKEARPAARRSRAVAPRVAQLRLRRRQCSAAPPPPPAPRARAGAG